MSVNPPGDRQRNLTVAQVRDRAGMDFVEVMFLESARIFHVSRRHEHFDQLLSRLLESEARKRALRITLVVPHGGDIEDAQEI